MYHSFELSLAIIIYRGLLDHRASLNLFPFMLYKLLELRALKRTKMSPRFTCHSGRLPRGLVEDVLIKTREFMFLVDFLMLKIAVAMCPKNGILIIPG